MIDVYEENNELVLLHNEGFKILAGVGSSITKTFFLIDFLRGVKNLLDLHHQSVITLLIENHVSPQAIKSAIISANVTDYLLLKNPNEVNVTFSQIRNSNQRLLVFTENGEKTEDGIYSTKYYKETTYSLGNDKLCMDREEGRAAFSDYDVKIFVLNHFYKQSCASSAISPVSGNSMLPFFKKDCEAVNNYHEIKNRVELCMQTGNKPTFIAVDFMEEGDALKVVVDLNDPSFYNKYLLKPTISKNNPSFSIDTGSIITIASTALISGVVSVFTFWHFWFKNYILPYYEIRLIRGGDEVRPTFFQIPLGGKIKHH